MVVGPGWMYIWRFRGKEIQERIGKEPHNWVGTVYMDGVFGLEFWGVGV